MKYNYNTPKSATSAGGRTSQQKLYSCPVCEHMGEGTKFVSQHLTEGCKGPGYKTRRNKRDGKYAGREAEAQLNTAVFNAQRMIKDDYQSYKEMRDRVQQDIDRMKEMGSYAKTIF